MQKVDSEVPVSNPCTKEYCWWLNYKSPYSLSSILLGACFTKNPRNSSLSQKGVHTVRSFWLLSHWWQNFWNRIILLSFCVSSKDAYQQALCGNHSGEILWPIVISLESLNSLGKGEYAFWIQLNFFVGLAGFTVLVPLALKFGGIQIQALLKLSLSLL